MNGDYRGLRSGNIRGFIRGGLMTAVSALALSGCVSGIESKALRGDHQAVLAEAGTPDYHSYGTYDLYNLCQAQLQVRKLSAFDECMSALKVKNNREPMEVFGGTVNKDYAEVFVYEMDAERHLALGNLDAALAAAERAYAASNRQPHIIPSGYFALFGISEEAKRNQKRMAQAVPRGELAVIKLLQGHKQEAAAHARQMEAHLDAAQDYKTPFELNRIQKWLAQYYYLNGQYEQAYATATRDDRSVLERLGDAYISVTSLVVAPVTLASFGFVHPSQLEFAMSFPVRMLEYRSAARSGHVKEARVGFDDMLNDNHITSFGALHQIVLHERGLLAVKEGDFVAAEDYLRRGIEVLESQRAELRTENHKLGFVGDKLAIYADMVSLLLDQGRDEEALEYAERGKARALVDLLAERKRFGGDAGGTGTLDLTAALEKVKRLERESLQLASIDAEGAQTRKLQIEDTKRALRNNNAELISLVTVDRVSVPDIQARLAPDEVLVEFYQSGDSLVAFTLDRDGVKAHRLDGTGLAAAVADFRRSVQDETSRDYLSRGQALYDRLIRPLKGDLDQPKLTIVPHGPLHYLPFAALHDGDGYLLDGQAIRLLPSASVLQYLNRDDAGNGNRALLAMGNPDLGDPLKALPGAEEETRRIAANWPGARVVLRGNASEALFKETAGAFSYLHLASHGSFDPENPLASAMELTPGGGEDGRLSVDELYNLNLNAELVTLSACETGLGDVANGDDVIGLTRGFLFAGARSINASLWPVNDAATAYLMERFYENLKRDGKAQALRKAQRATARQFEHPAYWAAFQLTGKG